MRAKLRKPRKRTSSFSKREKMRRKPLSLRKSRSISLRLRYMAWSYCQGSRRLRFGRNHRNQAEIERQLPGFVVFVGAVHDQMQAAPAAVRCRPAVRGLRPRRRPGPGESAKVMAVRAFAATI